MRRFWGGRLVAALLLAALALSVAPEQTAAATPPSCAADEDTQPPPLRVEAHVDPCTVGGAGESVRFVFLLSNHGGDRLSNVTVSARTVSGYGRLTPVACRPVVDAVLPGDSVSCTADYTTSAADLEMQTITLTALVSATASDNERLSRAVTVSAHVVARVLVHPNGPVAGAPVSSATSPSRGPDPAPLLFAAACALVYAVAVLALRRGAAKRPR